MKIAWRDLAESGFVDGTEIEIEGFACPFPAQESDADGGMEYFALAEEAPCCLGCLPRDPSRRIEVFARAPIPRSGARLRMRGIWRRLDDDPAGWRYQLRDARLAGAGTWGWANGTGFTRRGLLAGSLVCLAAAAPDDPAPAEDPAAALRRARAVIAERPTVDVHSHAGSINGVARVRDRLPFTPLAAPMRAGAMAVVCLAIVSDGPTHRVMADKRIHPYRTPDPGELYAFAQLAFERVHAIVRDQGLAVITDAPGMAAARGSAPSVVVAAEGGDFLEGQPDRVDEAYARWHLRHLQLTHYRVNELGDIQTEPPVHGGLTDAGAEVIRRCNRVGVVVDVAHGTFDLVKRAASVTTKPLLLSHTSLSTQGREFTRTITPDHARAIAGTGGVIGIWPPQAIFRDLDRLAAGFARMADTVGVDHVALGTDMQGLVGPSVFPSYDHLPALAVALLARGFNETEVLKLLGGNYVRLFTASMAS